MTQHPKKLLVIVAEAALEKALTQLAMDLGAHGYTVYDVRGPVPPVRAKAHGRPTERSR
jgi:hypothetical protein